MREAVPLGVGEVGGGQPCLAQMARCALEHTLGDGVPKWRLRPFASVWQSPPQKNCTVLYIYCIIYQKYCTALCILCHGTKYRNAAAQEGREGPGMMRRGQPSIRRRPSAPRPAVRDRHGPRGPPLAHGPPGLHRALWEKPEGGRAVGGARRVGRRWGPSREAGVCGPPATHGSVSGPKGGGIAIPPFGLLFPASPFAQGRDVPLFDPELVVVLQFYNSMG